MVTFKNNAGLGIFFLSSLLMRTAWSDDLSGFDCLIEPHSVVEVGTSEEGVLETLEVERGDVISKGQVLAILESEVEKVAVELARVRAERHATIKARRETVEFMKRELDRIADLVEKKLVPEQEKDKAETELALAKFQLQEEEENMHIAETELKRAREALRRRTIHSPIDGVVMEHLLSAGELVEYQTRIIKIAQIVPLNVEVIIPVEFYNRIDLGMEAEVTPHVPGITTRSARVVAVDPVVDAASNTFGVQLELPNEDQSVPGGIRCEIRFITQ